jgi:hypothetical protein
LEHVNGKETKKTIQCDNEKGRKQKEKYKKNMHGSSVGLWAGRGLVGTGAGIVMVKRSAGQGQSAVGQSSLLLGWIIHNVWVISVC